MISDAQFTAAYTAGFDRIAAAVGHRSGPTQVSNVDDTCQSAWLLAWRKRHQFRGDPDRAASILAWVYSIAINEMRSLMRLRRHRFEVLFGSTADLGFEPAHTPDPAAGVLANELLSSLRPSDRAMFLAYASGLTGREMAAAGLGKTVQAIKIRACRVRKLTARAMKAAA